VIATINIKDEQVKHIFILNPAAGKGDAIGKLLPNIIATAKSAKLDYELHRTTGPGEAEFYVRNKCEAVESAGRLRFYACGGDGTANEVLNGIYGFRDAELAAYPTGTGNDLVRAFPRAGNFRDIAELISGVAVPMDVIAYAFHDESTNSERRKFAVNMCNMGFDSEAVAWAGRLKTKPFFRGVLAYIGGVGISLIHKKALDLTLEFDDGTMLKEKALLTAVANGSYCGGGFKGVPDADPSDGILDVFIAKDLTRRVFLSLLPKYHKGTHFTDPRADDIFIYKRCLSVRVSSREPIHIAVDGEVFFTREASFSIVPNAALFTVPAKAAPPEE
jgi:YegS/Rv2252/BmrU family lipid kinase